MFEAVVSREAAQRKLIDDLLALFGGSTQPVMAHLKDHSGLPSDTPAWRESVGSSLLDGLQQQLGLQLKQDSVPMEVVVIDHIEKPAGS